MQRRKNGSAYLWVLGTVSVIFIVSGTFIFTLLGERWESFQQGNSMVALYLSEAGVERVVWELTNLVREPLVDDYGEVNEKLLKLLDIKKARTFKFTLTESDTVVKGGKYSVQAEFINVKETAFGTYLTGKGLPERLQVYHKENSSVLGPQKLAGWEGHLRILSVGEYRGRRRVMEVTKDIRVMDVSPPAPEHTLFISGTGTEYLRSGSFICDNGLASLVTVAQDFIDDVQRLMPYLKGSMNEMIAIIRDFVTKTHFTRPKEKKMEEIFQAYKVAGRIRTNGTLNVYLPFFELDDIINYFVSNSYYDRPEVGHLFCNNRLHDRFMSWATKFEGDIKKHYFELVPYVIETQKPTPKVEQYTRWSTFPNYTKQYPNEFEPENLERLIKHARECACEIRPGGTKLIGSATRPLKVDGLTYVDGDVEIGGVVSGRGMIVAAGDIYIAGDIRYDNDSTIFTIASLGGRMKLKKGQRVNIQAGVYLQNSIIGGDGITIKGNLVVKNLNRQEGEEGKLLMPPDVKICYDKLIRNILADNICVSISRRDIRHVEENIPDADEVL